MIDDETLGNANSHEIACFNIMRRPEYDAFWKQYAPNGVTAVEGQLLRNLVIFAISKNALCRKNS